jgi:hypothetical protein
LRLWVCSTRKQNEYDGILNNIHNGHQRDRVTARLKPADRFEIDAFRGMARSGRTVECRFDIAARINRDSCMGCLIAKESTVDALMQQTFPGGIL